jgi:hypothetical protein
VTDNTKHQHLLHIPAVIVINKLLLLPGPGTNPTQLLQQYCLLPTIAPPLSMLSLCPPLLPMALRLLLLLPRRRPAPDAAAIPTPTPVQLLLLLLC